MRGHPEGAEFYLVPSAGYAGPTLADIRGH